MTMGILTSMSIPMSTNTSIIMNTSMNMTTSTAMNMSIITATITPVWRMCGPSWRGCPYRSL